MSVKAGQKVRVSRTLTREGFWATAGKPGGMTVTLEAGSIAVAVMDELGGNVLVETAAPSGERVLVALAEGEFTAQ